MAISRLFRGHYRFDWRLHRKLGQSWSTKTIPQTQHRPSVTCNLKIANHENFPGLMGTCKGGLKPPRSPTCVKFSNLTFCGGLEHSSTSSSALILDAGEVSNNDEVLKERKFTLLVTFLLPSSLLLSTTNNGHERTENGAELSFTTSTSVITVCTCTLFRTNRFIFFNFCYRFVALSKVY